VNRAKAFLNEQYRIKRIINASINNNVKSIKHNENVVLFVDLKNVFKLG